MNAGEHRWSKPIGSAPEWMRNHPALKDLDLDWESMGQPRVRPGPLATKTLLFLAEAGNLSGDPGGPMFRAYDKATGKVIAEITLPGKASGAPMTYMHDGRQYIVIAVASEDHPAELVALALPGARQASAAGAAAGSTQTAATVSASPEQIAEGRGVYAASCAVCHGQAGEGIPNGPPKVAGLADVSAIQLKVMAGGIEMPPMSGMLSRDQMRNVALFVASGLPPVAPATPGEN